MDVSVIDDKYRVVRQLGEGGMGAVYEAEHMNTGRRVALKVIVAELLEKEDGIIARFQREARASGAIDSQYVVQVLDSGVDAQTKNPYIVMEYLKGEDLSQLLARLGQLPPDLVMRVAAQACLGLDRAHEAGIVHRDIKSANTYLSHKDNGEVVVKLLDFGIAKVRVNHLDDSQDHKLTRTGSMIGSPRYMSPEQARGLKTLDSRSDLWSLGIIMYEALTGVTPTHECQTLGDLILSICAADPRPVQDLAPWVSPELAAVVHRALSRDPGHRFASAREMYSAITAALGDPSITIREEMLVTVPDALRLVRAPRFGQIGSSTNPNQAGAGASSAPVSAISAAASSPGASSPPGATSAGVASTHAPSAKRSPVLWLAPLFTLVGVGAGVALYTTKLRATPDPAGAALVLHAGASAASSPAPSTPAPRGSIAVAVAVAPPAASVRVDGVAATPRAGMVDVSGTVGSVHTIELSVGDKTTRADVVISESGPVPARVELAAAAPPTTAAAVPLGKPGAAATARASSAATAAAATAPTATAKPTATAATPPTDPTINRNF